MPICIYQTTCTKIFIDILFIITPNWKLSKCLSTVEQINESWHSHTVEHYIVMRMNNLQLVIIT